MSIQEIAALTLAGCAVLTDLRYGKIRNPLIIAGWIAGVLIFIIPAVIYFVHGLPADGVNELLMLMGGVAVPLILGAVLFRLRMLRGRRYQASVGDRSDRGLPADSPGHRVERCVRGCDRGGDSHFLRRACICGGADPEVCA